MGMGWRQSILAFLFLGMTSATVSAAVVTGQAPIVSTADAAKIEARKDAMRQVVEQEVGVHVTGTTETSMGMVVADEIVAKSDGYVMLNKVLKEWQSGGYYFMQIDATANAQKIETAVQDLRQRLQTMSDQETSRSGIQVSVVERDADGRYHFTATDTIPYITEKLKIMGFTAVANDAVTEYLLSHAGDPDAGLQARRIARDSGNRTEENALLRGVLATEEVKRGPEGMHEAVVKASFELIGLDSNSVDAFSRYYSAVGKTPGEAERRARDDATRAAVEALGKQALETIQSEMRGGARTIKITAVFAGLSDFATQRQAIMNGMHAAQCRVIRSARGGGNVLKVFLSTDAYSNPEEVKNALMAKIPGLQEGIEDTASLGSSKLSFTF